MYVDLVQVFLTQLVQQHQGVLCSMQQDAGCLTELHKKGALTCTQHRFVRGLVCVCVRGTVRSGVCVSPAMMRSDAPRRVKIRSTGEKLRLSAGT